MAHTTFEQVIEVVRELPLEDQRRLRQWLQEQERNTSEDQQREEAVRQQVEKYRKAKNWIKQHRSEYMGQWVVLDGDRLISHGADGSQVFDQARAAGIETPFLVHVVEEEEPFYAGW
jgi:hypothetical protein